LVIDFDQHRCKSAVHVTEVFVDRHPNLQSELEGD